jgi:hypothetical protein
LRRGLANQIPVPYEPVDSMEEYPPSKIAVNRLFSFSVASRQAHALISRKSRCFGGFLPT